MSKWRVSSTQRLMKSSAGMALRYRQDGQAWVLATRGGALSPVLVFSPAAL